LGAGGGEDASGTEGGATEAPDPGWRGAGYTVANITSFSGSWFADREARLPDMRAPVPLRKGDPKYVATPRSGWKARCGWLA
jgi:hypothetical protein